MTAESLINLILLFFAYAFLGWCIEVTLKYFQFHRFINRGFLTGPWLPIYGSGYRLCGFCVFIPALSVFLCAICDCAGERTNGRTVLDQYLLSDA